MPYPLTILPLHTRRRQAAHDGAGCENYPASEHQPVAQNLAPSAQPAPKLEAALAVN